MVIAPPTRLYVHFLGRIETLFYLSRGYDVFGKKLGVFFANKMVARFRYFHDFQHFSCDLLSHDVEIIFPLKCQFTVNPLAIFPYVPVCSYHFPRFCRGSPDFSMPSGELQPSRPLRKWCEKRRRQWSSWMRSGVYI